MSKTSPIFVSAPTGAKVQESVQEGVQEVQQAALYMAVGGVAGFAHLQGCFNGSVVIAVDADYTPQGCPRCGHTSKANRPGEGMDLPLRGVQRVRRTPILWEEVT